MYLSRNEEGMVCLRVVSDNPETAKMFVMLEETRWAQASFKVTALLTGLAAFVGVAGVSLFNIRPHLILGFILGTGFILSGFRLARLKEAREQLERQALALLGTPPVEPPV